LNDEIERKEKSLKKLPLSNKRNRKTDKIDNNINKKETNRCKSVKHKQKKEIIRHNKKTESTGNT
jgi:hypothetical protein